MEKINFKKSSKEIQLLITEIERKAGLKARTPSDFNYLTEIIISSTNEMLSSTTLKRLWGYISGSETIRNSTLNLLSKYLGYKDWDDFITANYKKNFDVVYATELGKDSHLDIFWDPNRKIRIKHLNDNTFVIEEQINTIFKKGDTFKCPFFILNEPLCISEFKHKNNDIATFVFGGAGIKTIKVDQRDTTPSASGIGGGKHLIFNTINY